MCLHVTPSLRWYEMDFSMLHNLYQPVLMKDLFSYACMSVRQHSNRFSVHLTNTHPQIKKKLTYIASQVGFFFFRDFGFWTFQIENTLLDPFYCIFTSDFSSCRSVGSSHEGGAISLTQPT